MDKIHITRNGIALTVWPNGLKPGDMVHVNHEKKTLVIESVGNNEHGIVIHVDGRVFPADQLV